MTPKSQRILRHLETAPSPNQVAYWDYQARTAGVPDDEQQLLERAADAAFARVGRFELPGDLKTKESQAMALLEVVDDLCSVCESHGLLMTGPALVAWGHARSVVRTVRRARRGEA